LLYINLYITDGYSSAEVTMEEQQEVEQSDNSGPRVSKVEKSNHEDGYLFLDDDLLYDDNMKALFGAIVNFDDQIVIEISDERDVDILLDDIMLICTTTYYANVVSSIETLTTDTTCEIDIIYDETFLDQAKQSMAMAKRVADNIIKPDTSDFDKILTAYNYIILNTAYNEAAALPENSQYFSTTFSDAYDAYGVFNRGTAVCQGYTYALNLILNHVGIETRIVDSTAMNHSWSMVLLDGQWYHMDATYDDPVVDMENKLIYDYFLKNDAYMKNMEQARIDGNDQVANGESYYYDVYNFETFILNDITYTYQLKDNTLYRYLNDQNGVDISSKQVVVNDVSSWHDLEDEYYLIYTQASDGDLYIIDFDGRDKKHLVDFNGHMIVDLKSNGDIIDLTVVEQLLDTPISATVTR
jgi:hypothetical protein